MAEYNWVLDKKLDSAFLSKCSYCSQWCKHCTLYSRIRPGRTYEEYSAYIGDFTKEITLADHGRAHSRAFLDDDDNANNLRELLEIKWLCSVCTSELLTKGSLGVMAAYAYRDPRVVNSETIRAVLYLDHIKFAERVVPVKRACKRALPVCDEEPGAKKTKCD